MYMARDRRQEMTVGAIKLKRYCRKSTFFSKWVYLSHQAIVDFTSLRKTKIIFFVKYLPKTVYSYNSEHNLYGKKLIFYFQVVIIYGKSPYLY